MENKLDLQEISLSLIQSGKCTLKEIIELVNNLNEEVIIKICKRINNEE